MKRKLVSFVIGGILAIGGVGAAAQNSAVDPGPVGTMARSSTSTKAGISAEQRAALEEKLARIDAIMRAAQSDVVNPMSPDRARWMRESLYRLPLNQVKSIRSSGNSIATADAITEASKANTKALGSASSDLVYRPWAPCRFIDTRNTGGKINGIRTFNTQTTGTTYGGTAGCNPIVLAGVSDDDQIAAYTLNVTIVDTSTAGAPGFMTMRPAGTTQLTALVNWTVASAGFQLGNAATVASQQDNAIAANELEILTSGAVHAIVDLSGAFVPPAATPLSCTTVTGTNTPFPANSANTLAPAPACTAGYTFVSVECESFTNASRVLGINNFGCYFANDSASASTVRTDSRCCRVPGL